MSAETAVGDRDPELGNFGHKGVIQVAGQPWRRRLRKGGSPAFAAVRIQGKLGNRQNSALVVAYVAIHFTLRILKNAQVDQFGGDIPYIFKGVIVPHSEENE
jgi:hypothetical protein